LEVFFSILGPVNFYKTTIHMQNSSRSITLHVPAILFKAWPVLRIFVLVGLILFLVQVGATTIYDGLLSHNISQRESLNKELTQIEGTLDYLAQTSGNFLKDEQRLHSKYGLEVADPESRELGTGGLLGADSALLRSSSPVFEKMATLRETAFRLQGMLDNNNASFNSLTRIIGQNQALWRFVPTISPTQGRYASSFGPRVHPITGQVGKMHQGVDISNDRWTPIYAPADGVVDIAQLSSSFGYFVTLNHGNGIKTRYGHMQMFIVRPGQVVRRYQVIGYMGNTGLSVGPHLHYEVWVGNNPVNPLAYMLPGDHSVD